jgi:hypothetical protein
LDIYSASSLKKQFMGRHVAPHYPDSEPTTIGSFFLMLHAFSGQTTNINCIGDRIHDLSDS